jgi:hypothetical protein
MSDTGRHASQPQATHTINVILLDSASSQTPPANDIDGNNQDRVGNLKSMNFSDAYERFAALNRKFRAAKREHFSGGNVADLDRFPCWYCLKYFNKIEWLKGFPENSWHSAV